MFSIVSEPLPHGTSSERCNILQGGCLRGSGSNDNRVLHGIIFLECFNQLRNSRTLLSDSNIDTIELLCLIAAVVPTLLIQNGIEGHSSLSSLTITNDQLTLTTANWYHGI